MSRGFRLGAAGGGDVVKKNILLFSNASGAEFPSWSPSNGINNRLVISAYYGQTYGNETYTLTLNNVKAKNIKIDGSAYVVTARYNPSARFRLIVTFEDDSTATIVDKSSSSYGSTLDLTTFYDFQDTKKVKQVQVVKEVSNSTQTATTQHETAITPTVTSIMLNVE